MFSLKTGIFLCFVTHLATSAHWIKIGVVFPDPYGSARKKLAQVLHGVISKLNKVLTYFRSSIYFIHMSLVYCFYDSRSLWAPDLQLSYVLGALPETLYPMDVIDVLCRKMIPQKVSVILFLWPNEAYGRSTASAQYFIHMAAYTGIPILAWNADNSGLLVNKDFAEYRLLQLAPSLEHQVFAMIQILKRYHWNKNVFSITSKIAGYEDFNQKIRLFGIPSSDFNIDFYKLVLDLDQDDEFVRNQLKQPKSVESRIFLLYATQQESSRIFKLAADIGLTGEMYMWICTQSVVGDKTLNKNHEHIPIGTLAVHFNTDNNLFREGNEHLAVTPVLSNAPNVVAEALDLMLRDNRSLGTQLASISNCDSDVDFKWPFGKILYDYLKRVNISGLTGDPDEESGYLSFNEKGATKSSYLAILNLRADRKWDKVGAYYNSQLKMMGVTWPGDKTIPPQGYPEEFNLKVATLDETPFIIVESLSNTGTCSKASGQVDCQWGTTKVIDPNGTVRYDPVQQCCKGFVVDLLTRLSHDMRFTFTLYRVHDNTWGIKRNGTWNGLIKEILNRNADMVATSLKINSERAQSISFSVPFMETGIAIIVKLREGALSPTAFLEPFEYRTWIFILVISIHVAAVSIFLFEWMSPSSYNCHNKPPLGHKFSLFRSCWLVWATLFSASVSTDVPRSHTSRFMALIWAAFSLTFLAVYTANLAAFMITRSEYYAISGIDDPKFKRPDDVIPPFRYGTVEGGNTHQTLLKNYPHLMKWMEGTSGGKSYMKKNLTSGIQAVKDDEMQAFIYDAVALDFAADSDKNCEILTTGKWFSKTGYAFGFEDKSSHRELFNTYLLKYIRNGELERLRNFWFTGPCNNKPQGNSDKSHTLGVENFISAFVLLFGGLCISVFTLGLEYIFCFYIRRHLAKLDKNGWCRLISLVSFLTLCLGLLSLGRSLTFKEAADSYLNYKETIKIKRERKRRSSMRDERQLEKRLVEAYQEIDILHRSISKKDSEIETSQRKLTMLSSGIPPGSDVRKDKGKYYSSLATHETVC